MTEKRKTHKEVIELIKENFFGSVINAGDYLVLKSDSCSVNLEFKPSVTEMYDKIKKDGLEKFIEIYGI